MDQVRIALVGVLALAPTILVYRLCIDKLWHHGKSRDQRLKERAEKEGCVAEGVQLKSEIVHRDPSYSARESSSNPQYQSRKLVTYGYRVDGRDYECVRSFREKAIGVYGDPVSVQIYYDPHDPRRSVTSADALQANQKQTGCYLTLVITVAVFILLLRVIAALFGVRWS